MQNETADSIPQGITVLIVDDEPRLRDIVKMNLELEKYRTVEAGSGYEALEKLRDELPDIIILDVMMPEMDGYTALRHIREISTAPVIMLSVRDDERDRIHGLNLGADDYISKPFSAPELISRIKAVLRRTYLPAPKRRTNVTIDANLSIDFDRRKAIVRGKTVALRPTESRLLYHLVNNAGKLMSHETLLMKVWGREYREEDHYLRLYIKYLREKLEADPASPKYILTEHGMGYTFAEFEHAPTE